MPVRMNGALLSQLVTEAGGTSKFLDEWTRHATDADDTMDRSTLNRWINGRAWPKDSARFLRLAALLDVDPFALLEPEDGGQILAVDRIINLIRDHRMIPAAIGFMHEFFGRRRDWPPLLAEASRPWFIREFVHDPTRQTNVYARVYLQSDEERISSRPQTFHFAFRHTKYFGGYWLQYGTVFRHRHDASLWHINGHSERLSVAALIDPTPVKTWFGPGAAVFRVASLHPFGLRVSADQSDASQALTFPG